ncbi:MAG: prepilin peptidase [Candidatus Shapirobacteria bacterium]
MFILGTALGSFVNMLVFRTAVAYKLRKGKFRPKILQNRSGCDFCGKQLSVWENIPVVSWLVQGGESRCCATPLPRQYPLVELSTGILMLFTFIKLGEVGDAKAVVGGLLMLTWTTLLAFHFWFDLNYMILPDFATAILALLALSLGIINGTSLVNSLVGAGVGLLVIGGLWAVTKGQGMGLGDVKLAPVLGWWLGGQMAVVWLYLAFIIGAGVGVVLLALGVVKRKQPIPFGPFLIVAGIAAWWGQEWWRIVWSWFIVKI